MPDHQIILPRLSQRAAYGRIVAWLKEEGDAVSRGEALLVTETDKATIELTAEVPGVLTKVLHGAGQWVAVGAAVGVIEVPGEWVPG